MTPEQMELVAEARIKAAILFRAGKPGWDRPDSTGDPWYNPDEWDDQGNYYGPPKPMLPVPVNTDSPEPAESDSPPPDSPHSDSAAELLLKDGNSIRQVAKATGLSIGTVQRLKAKLKISD